ncbi:MAG: hypothetical protein CV089_00185 [Nitrospira sp. WS110]|nr:hypothetical protein [Nitrospira sp. WS110]
MKQVVESITMDKAVGLAIGGVFIAVCGLSSVTEAMPMVGITGDERMTIVSQSGEGSGAEILRLVGTRDHDEDPTPDGSTQHMNNPKNKMDKSMKQGPGAKSRSGQGDGTGEHTGATGNPSAHSDEKIGKGIDRPDDRRQGQNLERKP